MKKTALGLLLLMTCVVTRVAAQGRPQFVERVAGELRCSAHAALQALAWLRIELHNMQATGGHARLNASEQDAVRWVARHLDATPSVALRVPDGVVDGSATEPIACTVPVSLVVALDERRATTTAREVCARRFVRTRMVAMQACPDSGSLTVALFGRTDPLGPRFGASADGAVGMDISVPRRTARPITLGTHRR
jgi:hypothetical protein